MTAETSTPGRRVLEIATFANMTGTGSYITALTIFLVYVRDLSAAQAATVILLGTLGGKLGALPLSAVPPRFGGRNTYVRTKLIAAASMLALLLPQGWVAAAASLFVYNVSSTVGGAARNLLIRDVAVDDPKIFRARLRSLGNLGIVCGSLIAAALLLGPTTTAGGVSILLNALSCVICALITFRIPASASGPVQVAKNGPASAGARSLLAQKGVRTFLAVTVLFSFVGPITTFAIPIWVSDFVYPRDSWPVGALIATTAILVIVCQVPVTRFFDRRFGPEFSLSAAGALLAAACVAVGVSAMFESMPSLVCVWAAVVVLAVSEVVFSVATTEFLFAPARTVHLSAGSTLVTIAGATGEALGPTVLLLICLRPSPIGWVVLAVVIMATAALYSMVRQCAGKPTNQ